MKLPKFAYTAPRSVRDACRALAAGDGGARAIAGGTELLTALRNRQDHAALLVDLGALPLDRISYAVGRGLRIGALVSLRHLAAHPLVREKFAVLAQAARAAGSVQLQAMATLGGNLCQNTCCMYLHRATGARQSLEPCLKLDGDVCHVVAGSARCWATYAGDLAPALLVLRATLVIADPDGEKTLPLRALFSGDGQRPHTLHPGQIITEIRIPNTAPRSGGAYLKLRQRETLDYPLLGVAAHVTLETDGAICREAALALTGVDRAPVMVDEAGRLQGKLLTDESIRELAAVARKRAHAVNNVCGIPVRYRRDMVNVYAESALRQARDAAAH